MDASTNGHGSDHVDLEEEAYAKGGVATPRGLKSSVLRYLGVTAFLLMAVFWIWAFNNRDSIAHDDEFNDPAYSVAAEGVCSERQAAIRSFPLATAAENAVERGELIELGTDQLELMVAELNQLDRPTSIKGQQGVDAWLADYDVYIADRRRYADILSTGEDPPFLISRSVTQDVRVTDLLRTFAEVNAMTSCAPSGDV